MCSNAVDNNQVSEFSWLCNLPQFKNFVFMPFVSPTRHSKAINPNRKSMLLFVFLGLQMPFWKEKKKVTFRRKTTEEGEQHELVIAFLLRLPMEEATRQWVTHDKTATATELQSTSTVLVDTEETARRTFKTFQFATGTTAAPLPTTYFRVITSSPGHAFIKSHALFLSPEYSQSATSTRNKHRLLHSNWLKRKKKKQGRGANPTITHKQIYLNNVSLWWSRYQQPRDKN